MEETRDEEKAILYRQLSSQKIPWLVINHEKDEGKQIFFSISGNRYKTTSIPIMHNKCVWSSPHGWWILKDLYNTSCFLFNPLSMEKIQLPPLEQLPHKHSTYNCCLLTALPDDPNCHILLFRFGEYEVSFCQPGDEKFVRQTLEFQIQNVAMVGGVVYCTTSGVNGFFCLSFGEQQIEFRELRGVEIVRVSFPEVVNAQRFLIESAGELFCVLKVYSSSFFDEVVNFLILRRNGESGLWEELKSIGDRAIFLTVFWGLCCDVRDQEIRANCIYFVEENRRGLYVYDVESESITSILPCKTVSQMKACFNWLVMPVAES